MITLALRRPKIYHLIKRAVVPMVSLSGLLMLSGNVVAQENDTSGYASKGSGLSYDYAIAPFYQSSTDIDGGGDFSLGSVFASFKVSKSVSQRTSVGLSLNYDIDDYDFSGTSAFGAEGPWNDARRFGFAAPVFSRLDNNWSVSVSPTVDWLQENGASSSDSLSYGLTGFALKSFARGQSIGFGAGVFRDVDDDTEAFPFIAVDWRFNEKWRLSNPFEADVLGPAGLELEYRINDSWQVAFGGVYRRFRFRLDNDGPNPNGIGQNNATAGFLRLQRKGTNGLDFNVFAGATFNGELELRDPDGNELSSVDYDTAPFVAISLSGRF